MKAIYNINYGVYVLTTNHSKMNGCIVNTVAQITSAPCKVMVCVNKENFSCDEIRKSKVFNLSILDKTTSFEIIEHFGFSSGKNVNKFDNFNDFKIAENNVPYITKFVNSYLSLKVLEEKDVGSHIMFIAEVTADMVINSNEPITYAYYQNNLKPQKKTDKTVWICSVCGYVYEGDPIPDDFICPLCKHGASDFVKQESEQNKTKISNATNNLEQSNQIDNKNNASKTHTCLLCGYVYEGDTPPDACPVCGANMWK